MLLLFSISNKDALFIFSANNVAAEEIPLWVPLEQNVVEGCPQTRGTEGRGKQRALQR